MFTSWKRPKEGVSLKTEDDYGDTQENQQKARTTTDEESTDTKQGPKDPLPEDGKSENEAWEEATWPSKSDESQLVAEILSKDNCGYTSKSKRLPNVSSAGRREAWMPFSTALR